MKNSELAIFPILQLFNLIQPGMSNSLREFGFGLSNDANDIRFYLYTSASDPDLNQELIYLDDKSVLNSDLKIGEKTVFLIHGFWSNSTSWPFPKKVRTAYLKSSLKYNYIAVDWGLLGGSPYAKYDPLYPFVYAEVVKRNVPVVAKRVADFIGYLESKNVIRLDAIHIVGHSLGAHVAGWAGNLLQESNGGLKISRISGLDPAGPLYDLGLQRKLWQGDANFVDVYHTAMGTRGDSTIDGHVDFYPNGGFEQPLCSDEFSILDPFDMGSCSHRFVADIFAATISKDIAACKCSPEFMQELAQFKSCLSCTTTVLAGEPCPSNTRGQYYFATSSNP